MNSTAVNKRDGVVYTPSHIVDYMLNDLLPPPPSELGKHSICEPACGEGAYLQKIVERVCEAHKDQPEQCLIALQNIYGFDISTQSINKTKDSLSKIVARYFDQRTSMKAKWNVYQMDILNPKEWDRLVGKFDYVVGNPPYVSIQNLGESRREIVKENKWKFKAGSTDLFILFFEAGLKLLKQNGTLSFITSSSWMKSRAGEKLRESIRGNNYSLESITHFGDSQIFSEVSTYTAVTKLRNMRPLMQSTAPAFKGKIEGKKIILDEKEYEIDVAAKAWHIMSKSDIKFFNTIKQYSIPLKEIAEINVGTQTSANEIYVFEIGNNLQDGVYLCKNKSVKEIPLEAASVRPIVKASDSKQRIVIYPYENGEIISEDKLARLYPLTYSWLTLNKALLLQRDKGEIPADSWYAYGRNYGVNHSFHEKIITPFMAKKPSFKICKDKRALFYSGFSIRPTANVSTEILLQELNSCKMQRFIEIFSSPFRGGWYAYNKDAIGKFPISRKVLTK